MANVAVCVPLTELCKLSYLTDCSSDGFRKVVNTEHGGLRCIKDDYQFVNKNFCRDKPELLELVKRKVNFVLTNTALSLSVLNMLSKF